MKFVLANIVSKTEANAILRFKFMRTDFKRNIMRNRFTVTTFFILYFTTFSSAQQVLFGTNNYVEYQVGTLPFVISVPHGGKLEPSSIPNRTCNNAVIVTDAFTIETALEIKNYLFTKTGCYPHLIISHLKRNKLDPNRNAANAACGNPEAITAWNEFHEYIALARNSANQQYNQNTFFVDLHGHGNPIQRIELGYLLYDDELELADNVLNTSQYINNSSIKNLALSNANNYTHAQLLRGPKAFGSFLSRQNFPSVPSEAIPFPGTTSNYFSGGYITATHTCYSSGIDINGLQMELNFSGVRDSPTNRSVFAAAFSEAIIEYITTHFDVTLNACAPLSTDESIELSKINMYPNPVQRGESIYFSNAGNKTFAYSIYNLLGQIVKTGQLSPFENSVNTDVLTTGIYLLDLHDGQSDNRTIIKMVIQ